MKIKYRVHSVRPEQFPVKAKMGEREVDATVPGLVVELVRQRHGHTFRVVPDSEDELKAATELFQPGAKVQATFEKFIAD